MARMLRNRRRRRPARRPRRRLNRIPRVRKLMVPDVASASESIIFTGVLPTGPSTANFTTGVKGTTFPAYRNTDLSLSTFTRAPAIAANYQYYRIKYIEVAIVPDADTFFGTGGQAGKPFLYYIIDKGNVLSFQSSNQDLKHMGAKPVALDEKTVKIRWKPAVILANQVQTSTGTVSAQQYMISPWLQTDNSSLNGVFSPSEVCHYGLKWCVENVGTTLTYTATLTAHFEFKKPLQITQNTGNPEVIN